jgi:NADH-quinone oxidoreductase subunit N
MQFSILALPFAAATLVVILSWIFSPARFWFSRVLSVLIPVAALAAEIFLIWQPAANTTDSAFVFTPLARIFLTLLFGLSGAALVVAFSTGNLNSGRFSPVILGVSGALIATLYIENNFLEVLFLALAGLISIVALVDVENEDEERFVAVIKVAVRYLIASSLFGLTIFIALIFLERLRLDPQLTGLIKVIVALAVVGFAVRFAVFPFGLWLPDVLEEAPGLTGFIIVGMINVAAVALLVDFLKLNPTLVYENYAAAQPVMLLGMAGAVFAGLMALGQNGMGKMVAYNASADFGLILFGLASPHQNGRIGAVFEALTLAVAHLLIFGALAVVAYSAQGRLWSKLTGLGRRMPGAAIVLFIAFLAMAGAPFVAGFAGKYLILQSAAQEGLPWALAGGFAITLMAVAYFRYFHRIFMGADVPGLRTLQEPRLAVLVLVLIAATVILLGIYPAPVLGWLSDALQTKI